MVFDVSLEIPSDSKNYVSVQDDELTELVHASLNISNCRRKRKFYKCQAHADFIVCTSSVILSSCKRA